MEMVRSGKVDQRLGGTSQRPGAGPHRNSIRRSTNQDLADIRAWLEEEEEREVPGNFLCNFALIEAGHKRGELLVYIDGKLGRPAGYQLGGLIRPGILQVRQEYRRKGIGRKLVERCVSLALRREQPLLYITCEPPTSIPFWNAMGFTLLANRGHPVAAYRVLGKSFVLPAPGEPIDVVVSFYTNERQWNPGTAAVHSDSPAACLTPDHVVHLERRVALHEEIIEGYGDAMVEITINGSRVYLDKAKYPESTRIGVKRCINGYFIDQIRLDGIQLALTN